eukprot:6177824-Pleurochrysis_carterae.AAC.3
MHALCCHANFKHGNGNAAANATVFLFTASKHAPRCRAATRSVHFACDTKPRSSAPRCRAATCSATVAGHLAADHAAWQHVTLVPVAIESRGARLKRAGRLTTAPVSGAKVQKTTHQSYRSSAVQQWLMKAAATQELWHGQGNFCTPQQLRLQRHLRSCMMKYEISASLGSRMSAMSVLQQQASAGPVTFAHAGQSCPV